MPTTTSTRSATPARTKLARATAACAGSYSNVTTRPAGPTPRARAIVLYPASVPISSTRLARDTVANNNSSLACWADTSIDGMPAAAAASRAATRAASSLCSSRLNIASRACGSGSLMAPTVARPQRTPSLAYTTRST